MMEEKGIPVLVTTDNAAFFGYMAGQPEIYGEKILVVLTRCRMAVYWDAGVRGVLGLASDGPKEKCRISPAAARATIYDVTMVAEATASAAEKWESAPWSE